MRHIGHGKPNGPRSQESAVEKEPFFGSWALKVVLNQIDESFTNKRFSIEASTYPDFLLFSCDFTFPSFLKVHLKDISRKYSASLEELPAKFISRFQGVWFLASNNAQLARERKAYATESSWGLHPCAF